MPRPGEMPGNFNSAGKPARMPSTSSLHIDLVERRDGWHIEFVADDGTTYEQPTAVYATKEEAQAMVNEIVGTLRELPGAIVNSAVN